MEPWDLVGRGRYDQFAAFLVRNSLLSAKALHRSASSDAIARLKGAGPVIDAGVDNAAIVAGLMSGHMVFFFDDQQAFTRESTREVEGSRESDNACTDNEQVCLAISHRDLLDGTLDYTNPSAGKL
jgi:hypothetical protein